MSKIDRTYYKWNPSVMSTNIQIGDSKESLVKGRLIKEIESEDGIDYTGIDGTPWRVGFKEDKVTSLWFNRDSTFMLNGKELSGEKYSEVEPLLNSQFEPLNNKIQSVEEMKKYTDSEVLYVICRDYFITLIGIIKSEPSTR